ncbi:hypothetical protein G6F22_000523 [Rhizopus arrhizus]|nr:hypothetical protein G6F22_000523 [Rhizopus arrhizus]
MLHSLPTGEPSHETKSIEIDDNADETDKWLEDEEALLSDSLDMLEIDQNTGYGCSISAQEKKEYNNNLILQRNLLQRASPFNRIFKFGLFNVIQSKCITDAFYENNNLVISAPTGSGKTVMLELAIIRALLNTGNSAKIIYMAPTKSLCSERAKDWENKFKPFGIESGKEFTGDTLNTSISSINKTSIMYVLCVTTPEKWDSLTRRWIDEVHILNEKRGAVLEACVSRMKTMDSQIRYIAVSATVPNLNDIAVWLQAKCTIAFSEEYRPIRLERFVYGYPQTDHNMFLFDRKLDWKFVVELCEHSDGKPTLVFCSTRKSAQQCCETIVNMMEKQNIPTLCTGATNISDINFKNKNLSKLVQKGVAFHHAGLDYSDRTLVEDLFLKKNIRVVGTTSTLAVGVSTTDYSINSNKCHSIGYQKGALTEYTDIDLLQMIGRAGRLGLDTSGCAVIMTTNQMKHRYSSIVSGTTNLESSLVAASRPSTDNILQGALILKLDQLIYYGLIMDKYYIKFPTMTKIINEKEIASVKDVLALISSCQEEMDTVRYNSGEKQFLLSLKNNPNIRYPLEKAGSVSDKVYLILQCIFGDVSLHNGGNNLLAMEAFNILNHSSRITKCLIECSTSEDNPSKLKSSIQLYQSIQAKLWYDSPYVIRQISGIGPQFAKALSESNLITLDQLRECDPSPAIPNFYLNVENKYIKGEDFILKVSYGLASKRISQWKVNKGYYAHFWVETSEGRLVCYRRVLVSKLQKNAENIELTVKVTSSSMTVYCHLQSEDYVGIDIMKEVASNADPRKYIMVSTQSNMLVNGNVNANKEEANKELAIEPEQAFDDDIDPQLWRNLAEASTSSVVEAGIRNSVCNSMQNNSYPVAESSHNQNHFKTKMKNTLNVAKKNIKSTEPCAHTCCKIVLSLEDNLLGKQKRPISEEQLPESYYPSKKIKQGAQLSSQVTTNVPEVKLASSSKGGDCTSIFVKDMEKRVDVAMVEGKEVKYNDDFIMHNVLEDDGIDINIFNFDEDDYMENIKNDLKYQEFNTSTELKEPNKSSPVKQQSNKPEKINSTYFSDPCQDPFDKIWEDTGMYIQKGFSENDSFAVDNTDDQEHNSNKTYDINAEQKLQSKSLLEWIANSVEIVREVK